MELISVVVASEDPTGERLLPNISRGLPLWAWPTISLAILLPNMHRISSHLCGFWPISISAWPMSASFNLYASLLTMLSSCFGALNVLGFISRIVSTFLVWFCSQRTRFLLKKLSRVIPEEPIILTTLMLFVLTSFRRCQVGVSWFTLSGFCLPIITFIFYNLKQPKIVSIQQPQTSFVRILIWLPDSMKVVEFFGEIPICLLEILIVIYPTFRISLLQIPPQRRDI